MKSFIVPLLFNDEEDILAIPKIGKYIKVKKGNKYRDELNLSNSLITDCGINELNEKIIEERRNFPGKFEEISSLHWLITSSCKGKCTYCYADHARDNKLELCSFEKLEETCANNNIDLNKIKDIQILGGEPLLFPAEILKLADKYPNIIIGISTGLMVPESTFNFAIKELSRRENISFSISIDPYFSPYPRIYEGKEFYTECLERLSILDKHTYRWGIRATISNEQQDINKLEADIRRVTNDYKHYISWTVDLLMGQASLNQTAQLQSLVKWTKGIVDKVLQDEREELLDPILFKEQLPFPVKQLFPFLINFGLYGIQLASQCDMGTGRIVVGQDGELHSCAESPMTKFKEEWKFKGVTEDFINNRYYNPKECLECDIFQFCGGICFFNYKHYGLNLLQCEWYKEALYLSIYAYFNFIEKSRGKNDKK